MRTRAFRRHQKGRMRQKAKRLVRDVWSYEDNREEVTETMVKNCDNLKMCNKDCCKNPRRSGWLKAKGKTAEELISE